MRIKKACTSLAKAREGSIAVQFALAIPVIAGLIGASVDYTRTSRARTVMQSSLDAAVIAGARDQSSEWEQSAAAVFAGNLIETSDIGEATPVFSKDEDGSVSGSVNAAIPMTLVKVLGFSQIDVAVAAVAQVEPVYDNSCILTLGGGDDVQSDSLTFNGAPNIQLDQCTLRSNTSMRCNGHGGGAVASIAAGSVSGCSNPEPSSRVVPDTFAELAEGITAQCGASRPGVIWAMNSPVPAGVITVSKATHTEYHVCGNLTLSGSGFLTGSAPTSDSVIVVENGNLTIANNASISTKRIAIVLTGNNSYASSIIFPNGQGHAASLTLSPPTTVGNPWRGVSLYQDPILTNGVDHDWGPAATLDPDGVIYLPNSELVMRGNSASSVNGCTKVVVNSFTTNGAVNLSYRQNQNTCDSLGVSQWFETEPYLSH